MESKIWKIGDEGYSLLSNRWVNIVSLHRDPSYREASDSRIYKFDGSHPVFHNGVVPALLTYNPFNFSDKMNSIKIVNIDQLDYPFIIDGLPVKTRSAVVYQNSVWVVTNLSLDINSKQPQAILEKTRSYTKAGPVFLTELSWPSPEPLKRWAYIGYKEKGSPDGKATEYRIPYIGFTGLMAESEVKKKYDNVWEVPEIGG